MDGPALWRYPLRTDSSCVFMPGAGILKKIAIINDPAWKSSLVWFVAVVCFVVFSLHIVRKSLYFPNLPHRWDSYIAIAIGVVVLGILLKCRVGLKGPSRRIIPWLPIPALLFGVWYFIDHLVGDFELDLILFHFQIGFGDDAGTGAYQLALNTLFMVSVLIASGTYLAMRSRFFRALDIVLAIVLIWVNPLLHKVRNSNLVASSSAASISLLDFYRKPEIVREPRVRKNLIYIYMESLERSFADRTRFGAIYDDIAALESKGVSFLGVREITGTNWSIAGMVASQCGVPILPVGLNVNDATADRESFMKDITCLGDLLDRRGYKLSFIHGLKTNFMQFGNYYNTHGFDFIAGEDYYRGQFEAAREDWGLPDDVLFDLSLQRIRALTRRGTPYAHFVSTMTAHFPNGKPTANCRKNLPNEEHKQLFYAVRCLGYLVRDFYDALDREGLLENTIVVLGSDHLMPTIERFTQGVDRQNTLIILDKDRQPATLHRHGSMIDVYPTLLEALGYEIKDRRAGLGVSLFSNGPALVERIGHEKLNAVLRRDLVMRKWIWGIED